MPEAHEQEAKEEDEGAAAEKTETETSTDEKQINKAEFYKKTEKSQKLYDDLSTRPFSASLTEKLSKLIAEICKDGKRIS